MTLHNVSCLKAGSTAHDCVPEGFGLLVGVSIVVMLLMILLISWMASPRLFCQCCGNIRRGFGDAWVGSRQLLLEATGRDPHGGNGVEAEVEDYWTAQPQTSREVEMQERQRKRMDEEERTDMEAAAALADRSKED
jgi:hypothetical protein